MPKKILIRRNEYRDSVQLMLAAGRLLKWPGMSEAVLMMGTPSNKEFLRSHGLSTPESEKATANDLIIALDAAEQELLERAQSEMDGLLKATTVGGGKQAPRTIEAAVRQLPGANLCVISVPGEYAAAEARRALRAGLHVLLFSDNVSAAEERELKELARDRGRLCMGPDCGVVNVNGAGLVLASIVRGGPIGIAGASGSGIQEVAVLAERWGLGLSQAIGTGGRDLDDAVGGLATELAIETLDADADTKVIVVVAPSPGVATVAKLAEWVRRCTKPVVVSSSGPALAALRAAGVCAAGDLEETAALAVTLAGGVARRGAVAAEDVEREFRGLAASQRYVRGLFCGGTFLKEALRILTPELGGIYSNAAPSKEFELSGLAASREHTLVDYGAEEFTAGRPHPVIDPQLRKERLEQEGADPEVAVLLLDIILGPAIYPDPAGFVADAIVAAKQRAAEQGRYLSVVASVCGAEGDPQGLSRQEETLRAAGVVVLASNAEAARFAAQVVRREVRESAAEIRPASAPVAAQRAEAPRGAHALFEQKLKVVNVGLSLFAEALARQGVELVAVDWRPPAGGDAGLAALLEKLGG